MMAPSARDPATIAAWIIGAGSRYGYGSIPINTIFRGMNIHKSQLFWGSLGTRVLTHPHIMHIFVGQIQLSKGWNWSKTEKRPGDGISDILIEPLPPWKSSWRPSKQPRGNDPVQAGQPNATVEGLLEVALDAVLPHPNYICLASRTDKGVSARMNYGVGALAGPRAWKMVTGMSFSDRGVPTLTSQLNTGILIWPCEDSCRPCQLRTSDPGATRWWMTPTLGSGRTDTRQE